MAVQIPPGVQRIEPQAPQSVGRIRAEAPDPSRAFAQVTQGVSGVLNAADQAMRNIADTKGNEAANAFEQWYRTQLYGDSKTGQIGLVHMEGDPTEAYNKFDEEAIKKLEELSSNNSWVPGVQAAIKKKLANKFNSLHGQRLTAYGAQYAKYEQKVTDQSVQLEKNNASLNMAYVRPDDETSLAPFEANIGKIKELRIRHALKMGSAKDDPNGKVLLVEDDGSMRRLSLNDSVKYEIAKDVSDATYGAIHNLITADQVDSAKVLMEKFDHQLDPVNRAKLTESLRKTEKRVEAYNHLNEARNLPFEEQQDYLETIRDPEIRHTVSGLLDVDNRRKAVGQQRQSTKNYNILANYIADRMKGDQPFQGLVELEGDPEYKRMIDFVTDPKQRRALEALVEKPKISNQEVKSKMMDKLISGELAEIKSYADLVIEMSGLNEKDANRIERAWEKQRTMTDSELRSRQNYISREIRKHLSPLYMRGSRTKLRGKDLQELNEIEYQIRDEIEALPKMSPEAEQKWIKERITQEVLKKRSSKSSGGWFSGWFGGSGSQVNAPSSTSTSLKRKTPLDQLSDQEFNRVVDAYRAAHNGQSTDDPNELQRWYESNYEQ